MFNNNTGIVVYADDNWLLAPSHAALQDMINTCVEYANDHNLTFSTDKNPVKSKTKCLVFLKKQRDLLPLKLGADDLPFTDTAKHLGHYLDNSQNSIKRDMTIKRAMTVQKNNEICQEFCFSHPLTKLRLNQIYNFSYTGCQLWDLFCKEAVSIENSYNVSIRTMLGLPFNTHRYLIQPLAGEPHVKQVFVKRFLTFCDSLRNSGKNVIRETFEKIKSNVRTVTGSNLAELSQLVDKPVQLLTPSDASKVVYAFIDNSDKFRVDFIREILDLQNGSLTLDGFNAEEYGLILKHLCTS